MQNYAELDARLSVISPTDGVLLKLCLQVMLFYQDAHTEEKRKAVLALLEEHAALTGEHYRWTQNPKTKSWKSVSKGRASYIQPKEWLFDVRPGNEWSFIYHGGAKASDASNIEFYTDNYGEVHGPGDISYVLMQFPVELFDNTAEGLPELTRRWCGILQPKHGYGGLCLGRSHGYEHGEASSYEYTLASRFPGVDVRWTMLHSMRLNHGTRGADWLTILSDEYLEQLGGLAAIKERMEDLPVLAYQGGAVLQAGALPQVGDNEQGIDIPEYKKVGAIVEPVRHKNYGGIHIGSAPNPKFSKEEYAAWLARFSPEQK